jgi:hypothetical protein
VGASTSAVGRCDEMMIRLFQRRRGCPDEARDRAIEPSSHQAIERSSDSHVDRWSIERPTADRATDTSSADTSRASESQGTRPVSVQQISCRLGTFVSRVSLS